MTCEQRLRELVRYSADLQMVGPDWVPKMPVCRLAPNPKGDYVRWSDIEAIFNEESEGWILVPREPTDEMLEKGCAEHSCEQGDPYYSKPQLSQYECRNIYRAMLKVTLTKLIGACTKGKSHECRIESVCVQ